MELKDKNFQKLIEEGVKKKNDGFSFPINPFKNLPNYSEILKSLGTPVVDYTFAHEAAHIEMIKDNTQAQLDEFIQFKEIILKQSGEITELRNTIKEQDERARKNKWKERSIGALITIGCGLVIFCLTNPLKVIDLLNSIFPK